jgi:hypothetical protein
LSAPAQVALCPRVGLYLRPHVSKAECASGKNPPQPMQTLQRKRCQLRTRPRKKACVYGALVSGPTIFGYVGGNPLSYSDPLGLQAFAPTPWGPMLMPIPVTPGGQSHAPVPGWDPADGPAPTPGTGTIIWPPGFSPNPEPTQCRIDVPPPKPIVPPKPDCEQQLKSCMAIAKAQKSIFMSGACFVAYGICKKVFQ